ncbi:RsmB/NOP family class I SAM-dependent RNA methyltransferase [Paenibacillus pinistramenti]|uniref:RsmB/NOP family class I SAM-dependent RNA methyltransferase n=1 Tax=Paenibacillus pinistramenti TaxID=1768003 RepID=UPI0011086DAF|nr:RsmB/NOP family class I SAM-dependent RNA methyltransferase [Paenibacillus pinistramenti]
MSVTLPPLFLERMQSLLGDEYPDFAASYDHPRYAGIRINTLKISPDAFKSVSPFPLQPVPWCSTGYYTEEGQKPGKHPYYHAGLYYIQEPSAMAPAEALNVQPGDRVLDLCAAPGGKSTQLAAKLQGSGVLVTNDISDQRTKALAKNIELYGIKNAVVLNETPERIREAFPGYFNKILIDAPCSGEGMFRKDEAMARQWETHSVEVCSAMQRDILMAAAGMLAPGGTIVYSTCTFAPEENEAQIAEFLTRCPEFEVVSLPPEWGIAKGHPHWLTAEFIEPESMAFTSEAAARTADTGRLWPHLIEGEGHFVAVLRHTGQAGSDRHHASPERVLNASAAEDKADSAAGRTVEDKAARLHKGKGKTQGPEKRDKRSSGKRAGTDSGELLTVWEQFAEQHLTEDAVPSAAFPVFFGTNLYLSPVEPERLNGLKTVRPGWYAGTVKNGRFVPGQPLASALKPEQCLRSVNLALDDHEAVKYLKGETLQLSAERLSCVNAAPPKGYVLVCVNGYSLGWGKWQDGMLKNEYPPGWRWT